MRGGEREGAGRKPTPKLLKKTPKSIKLPEWLWNSIDDLARKTGSNRAVLIEEAMTKRHKLKCPALPAINS